MKFSYPELLPISAHKQEIVNAIAENQVVVVVGETGSGKSTQIPKMVLQALATRDLSDPEKARYKVACTQPRRIAATSIASWISHEMGVELGKEVGYKIRFDDDTTAGTMITVCTDGILLQEMKGDGLLSHYDAIMVDEAHERNLNIDFLLGLLKDIQVKRVARGMKELKIVVTSATVDAKKFADFFADLNVGPNGIRPIPIVNVSGRMFPVEIKYDPIKTGEEVFRKMAMLLRSIASQKAQGDVLIFMPGEAEIFKTMSEIELLSIPRILCLPLYSRLTMEEQERIYGDFPGKLKVVIATNIAETSLTVPGIKYVIDAGVARMTDFNFKTGIGSLEIMEISQSSAVQRAGRAGRVQAGIAIRLYEQAEFLEREKYTKPEIQRSDLSSVVLHMILIGIKDIQGFNFIDAPEPRAFKNAIANLHELGALDEKNNLTELGLKMAHLPLEPRISAMLLAAERYDCVREVAVIASSLSVKDPFLRPNGEEEEADRAKRYFQRLATGRTGDYKLIKVRKGKKLVTKKVYETVGERVLASDLMVFLFVWNKLQDMFTEIERDRYCKSNYLNFKVFVEIEQIYLQLLDTLKNFAGESFAKYLLPVEGADLKVDLSDQESILKAISTGFIQNLCELDGKQNYKSRSAENIFIHPGSTLFTIIPSWFVSAEIIETTRLYARNNTMIDPKWFEEIAPQLCEKKRGNIFFEPRDGRVLREEEVFFRDHKIVKSRLVDVGREDKALAQEYFVREGMVKRALGRQFPFLLENEKVVDQLKIYASKLNNPAMLLDAKRLQKYYIDKSRKLGLWLTSKLDLEKLLQRYGVDILKIDLDDFVTVQEREHLDKLFPAELFLNGVRHEVRYFYNDYRYPSGPVISLTVQELVGLNDAKLASALVGLGEDFKPHFIISNGEAFGSSVAEGVQLDVLRKEVDRWHLKKAWKVVRRENELKGIRPDEIFHYLPGVLERVEIGHSLFFGSGENAIVYAYVGLRMEGRKIAKVLFEEREIALKMTVEVLKVLFLIQVKANFYFKESDILRLDAIYEQYFETINIQDCLAKKLWQKLDFEAGFSDFHKIQDVDYVKAFLERKRLALTVLKEAIIGNFERDLLKINKLAQSGESVAQEQLVSLKKALEG